MVTDVAGVFIAPVFGVDTPGDDGLIIRGDNLSYDIVNVSIGRTEEFDALSGITLDCVFRAIKIGADFVGGKSDEVFMNPGVASDVVALARHTGEVGGVSVGAMAERKERSLSAAAREDIEETTGRRTRAVVES